MTNEIDLVVLDMAGTTVDEGQWVYRVLAETVAAHGGTASDADIAAWHGAAKHEALRALLTPPGGNPPAPAELDAVVADFRARLAEAYAAHPPRPLPGVVSTLEILRANGIRVALSTGFDSDTVAVVLDALGWEGTGVVDTVVCGSDVAQGRPAPYMVFHAMERLGVTDVARVLVAGDTPRDLAAGTNSGAAYVVGVLSGADTAEVLGAHPHTHLLDSVADLPRLLALPDAVAVRS